MADIDSSDGVLQLMIADMEVPGWPLASRLELRNVKTGATWTWMLSAKQVGEPVTINIPVDSYDLLLTTESGREVLRMKKMQIPPNPQRRKWAQPAPRRYLTSDGNGRLVARRDARRDVTVVVPDAAGTLRVRAQRTSGQPLAGLRARIRIGGEELPAAVLRHYLEAFDQAPVTGSDGELVLPRLPAGVIELALDGAGWLRTAITGGETRVVQKFARR